MGPFMSANDRKLGGPVLSDFNSAVLFHLEKLLNIKRRFDLRLSRASGAAIAALSAPLPFGPFAAPRWATCTASLRVRGQFGIKGLDGLGFGLGAPICGIETPRISGGRSIAHFIL